MKKDHDKSVDVTVHSKSTASTNKSVSIADMLGWFNGEDTFINAKLVELKGRCNAVSKGNLGRDEDYAANVITAICDEMSLLKLKFTSDIVNQEWYTFDKLLLRNIDSIVFKMDILTDRYFRESYKKYNYISFNGSFSSRDELKELAYEWLSYRRTMVDVVTAMLDEIQGLGITSKPVTPKKAGIVDFLPNIFGTIH
jgi:hypothetical protein